MAQSSDCQHPSLTSSAVVVQPMSEIRSCCDHTLHLFTDDGRPQGSWAAERTENGLRYSCQGCGKFYGYAAQVGELID